MGFVEEQRAQTLLEQILLPSLKDGIIPDVDLLEREYEKASSDFGPLTQSAISKITLPQRWEESSASKFNDISSGVRSDLQVLLRSLVLINELSISKLSEWSARGKALQSRMSKLLSRIDSLLLSNSDTAGYLAFIEDNFRSLENVSFETTAQINPEIGEVSISVDRTDPLDPATGGTRIDTTNAEISIALIEGSNSKFLYSIPGSNPKNILSDSKTRWGSEIQSKSSNALRTSSRESKPIMVEVKIRLSERQKISRLLLISSDATAGSGSVVLAQYSLDGYRWEVVPSESPTQSGTGNFSFHFPRTEMEWIKFIISKSSPDAYTSSGSIRDFGIQSIRFYSEQYDITEGSTLVGELLTPRAAGEALAFGRAALDVCQEVPSGTSIEYFLRAYEATSETYTDWVQTYPLTDSPSSIVDFEAPIVEDTSDITTIYTSTLNAEALNITRTDDVDTTIDYRFFSSSDVPLNFYVGIDIDELSELTLLRNTGYSDGKYPTVTTDKMVADVPCGWGLKGNNTYYCMFRIKNPDGLSINFGDTTAVIDGRSVSGLITISAGWHSFETRRANWGVLDSSLFASAPLTSLELKNGDPLYPYNHKYLIEGYNYPDSFSGEKVYLGVDQYGERLMTRVPLTDFNNRGIDLDVYGTDTVDGPRTIFLLKYDSSRPSFQNERSRLFYTVRMTGYDAIQFKAVLKSEELDRTPILTYYRIKVK